MYWKYHKFHSCYALVKLLIFSTHSMKYIWFSPQNRKYPLFLNEINSEKKKKKSNIITFVIFTVCKNGSFMNSGTKSLIVKVFSYAITLTDTLNMFNFIRNVSRNGPDEPYGRNARSRERTSADFTFQSKILVLTLSNGLSKNLQLLVSLCEHGTV